jgi:hypothetical protein
MSSLVLNSIGEAGARELFTALQFNKTLAELKWGWDVALETPGHLFSFKREKDGASSDFFFFCLSRKIA